MRVIDTDGKRSVGSLTFAPDGRLIAIGLVRRGVALYDLARGRPALELTSAADARDRPVAFSADGTRAYTVTAGGRTGFSTDTGARVEVGPDDPDGNGGAAAFAGSARGDRLVTAQLVLHGRAVIRLNGWAEVGGEWTWLWRVDENGASNPAMAPSGNCLAYLDRRPSGASPRLRLILRDAATGSEIATGAYPHPRNARLSFRPDGRQVVAPFETTLVVWDTRMPGMPALVRNDSRQHFTAAAYHPSGRYLFTAGNDASVSVWDTEDWVRVKRFDWDIGRLRAVAVSPDGLLAAAGSDRGRVVVWDVDV